MKRKSTSIEQVSIFPKGFDHKKINHQDRPSLPSQAITANHIIALEEQAELQQLPTSHQKISSPFFTEEKRPKEELQFEINSDSIRQNRIKQILSVSKFLEADLKHISEELQRALVFYR